jgi:hypothetical protein
MKPLAYARGSEPSRDRQGVPMALRAADSHEDALAGRSARAHASSKERKPLAYARGSEPSRDRQGAVL